MNPEPSPAPIIFAAPSNPQRGRTALAFLLAAILVIGSGLGLRAMSQRGRERERGIARCFKGDMYARYSLGLSETGTYASERQWREAETEYRAALKDSPRLARARRGLAAVKWLGGDRKAARSIMLGPADVPDAKRDVWLATQAAFGAIPKPSDSRTLERYRTSLRDKSLGWARYVAQKALAPNAAEARRIDMEMRGSGRSYMAMYIVMALGAFLCFPLGIALIVIFFVQPQRDLLPKIQCPAWRLTVAMIAGLVGPYLIFYPLRRALAGSMAQASDAMSYFVLLGTYVVWAAIVAFAVHWAVRPTNARLSSLGWTTRGAAFNAVGGYIAIVPVVVIAAVLGRVAESLFPKVETPMNSASWMSGSAHGWSLVAIFLTVCVVGPWVEEVLFRGLLFRALQPSFGFWGAAFLSSAGFAALHPQLPLGFLPLWCIGVGLCVVYRRSGSLTAAWMLHGLNNTISVIMSVTLFGHLHPWW